MSDGVCSHQSVPHITERQKARRNQEKEPLPPPVTPPPPSSSDWCRSETSYDVTASSVLPHNTPTPPGFPLPRQQGELLCAGGMCAMSHRLPSHAGHTRSGSHTHKHFKQPYTAAVSSIVIHRHTHTQTQRCISGYTVQCMDRNERGFIWDAGAG